MLELLVSVTVLPILCDGRTGRGLWDQLPVHGSDQYYKQLDHSHQLPSYQYYSDRSTDTKLPSYQYHRDRNTDTKLPSYQYHRDRNTDTKLPSYQYHRDRNTDTKLPSYQYHGATQLPPQVTQQYPNRDRQLPNSDYIKGRNIIQKRTLAIDNNSYEDKQHSPAGFWGQIVNKGVQESGKDFLPRHSTVSKGIQSQRASNNYQNNENTRSHKKQSQRKVRHQNKTERPTTFKSVQNFYDRYADDNDEYNYDYDEYNYDYEYYDEDKRESDAGIAGGAQDGENEALRAHRLNAKTLKQLQSRPKTAHDKGKTTASRRVGVFSDRHDIDATIGAMEELLGLNGNDADTESGEKLLAAQINAVAVLDMIKNLQDEIKEINEEIDRENIKMKNLKESKKKIRQDDEFEIPVQNAAQISTKETMKELSLQKEDATMKKVIAQLMLMKQIQKKKEENVKLEMALKKLAERRKIINVALKQQQQIADEKRQMALEELKRQKKLMSDREQLITMLKEQKEEASKIRQKEKQLQREKEQKRKQMQRNEPQFQPSHEKTKKEKTKKLQRDHPKSKKTHGEFIADKSKILDAHKLLVDKSNERILAKIEEIKLTRQKEAISEQQKLLQEQQSAINVLRELKKQRLKQQKESLRIKEQKQNSLKKAMGQTSQKTQTLKTKISKNLRPTNKTPVLNLNFNDKKKVLEWLDLERNAAILEKTDQAIAEKLRAKNFGQTPPNQAAAEKVKSAAQVLLEAENSLTDAEIDDILGLTGITETDADILGLNNPSILDLDDDYEDYQDDDYEYYKDYEDYEYYYDTDYDEYDEPVHVDYDYEYEDVPIVIKTKPPKPKKKLHGHFLPNSNNHRMNSNSGSVFLNDVTDILGQAEDYLDYGEAPHVTLSGSLRKALLKDIDGHVRTEVNRLPGGRVSTKVTIGGGASAVKASNQRNIPKRIGGRRKSNRDHHERGAFSDLMSNVDSKSGNSHKISFSEMMGDLLHS